ncbi:DUF4251 domain-containing protein [Robiginitalea sp.]|uniref:DUF4251 domain-containing protein n=1 Tax=Robiginitalea sp. TaxID=1902411 RepID=UPI003C720EE8
MRISNRPTALFLSCLFLLLTFSACKSAEKPLSPEEQARLDRIVADRNFTMIAQWAEPTPDAGLNAMASAGLFPPGSSPSRINLGENSNYFKMKGDSVFIQLPYYGERQVVKTYGRAEGITYEGLAKDLKVNRNTEHNYYDIGFSAKDRSEIFLCNLRLYGGKRALLTVQSNQRNQIRYDGNITVDND